jgi:hypothetical protein
MRHGHAEAPTTDHGATSAGVVLTGADRLRVLHHSKSRTLTRARQLTEALASPPDRANP